MADYKVIKVSEQAPREWGEGTNYGYKIPRTQYQYLHLKVRKKYGRPNKCEDCGVTSGTFHWANLGVYNIQRHNWRRLCVKCHHRLDKNSYVNRTWKLNDEQKKKAKIRIESQWKTIKAKNPEKYRLLEERNKNMIKLHQEGKSYSYIASLYDVCMQRVGQICKEAENAGI